MLGLSMLEVATPFTVNICTHPGWHTIPGAWRLQRQLGDLQQVQHHGVVMSPAQEALDLTESNGVRVTAVVD